MAVKLIACFCGCSELEIAQVKKITNYKTIRDFLDNPEARRLLSQYIIKEMDDEEDNLTLKYLRTYEICLEFIRNPDRDQLVVCAIRQKLRAIDCYPNEQIERQVQTAFRQGGAGEVYDVLMLLQRELELEIDGSSELRDMREKLLTKIDMVTQDKPERRK